MRPSSRSAAGCSASDGLQHGTSLIEVLLVMAGMLVISAMAAPAVGSRADELSTAGAARYLATLLQRERLNAIRRSAHVAWQFQTSPNGDIRYAAFVDGNGNGVRTVDVARGIDTQVTAWESLSDRFAGVTMSIAPGVLDIDTGSPITGDPVRLGGSDLLSFSPTGTATSGTLYLSGRSARQYAIRTLGATGRVRILRFMPATGRWGPP